MLKVIAFDVFGTVVSFAGVNKDEIRDYARQLHAERWAPLRLPKAWEQLPAHPDSAEGIARLRRKYFVVTCSNGPLGLMAKLSKHNGISWDAIIPLEMNMVYKPNPRAYLTVCEVLGVTPQEVMMVTANKTFGDLEASAALGMTPCLIRDDMCPANIIELAQELGC